MGAFLIGYSEWNFLPIPKTAIRKVTTLSVMSYNVRLFNAYEWIDDTSIPNKALIEAENHDVICFQNILSATHLV